MKRLALLFGIMCVATYFMLSKEERKEIAEILTEI
jgi:hypothetical protein